MSESFAPIHAIEGVQYRQVPEITFTQSKTQRVYDDKVIDTITEFTTYDKNGDVKTAVSTSQTVNILV